MSIRNTAGDWPLGDWPVNVWPRGDWPLGDWPSHSSLVSVLTTYMFSSTAPDYLAFSTPFTGNIKVMLAAPASTGIHVDVISGIKGIFTPSMDPLTSPKWVKLESNVTSLEYIVDDTFNGVVGAFALNDVWYSI